MSPQIGQQVGAYRLTHLVARESGVDTYLGEHVRTGVGAMVKLFRSRLKDGQEPVFLSEARKLARIIHPHIVNILDFGLSDNTPFIVLDWTSGSGSLRQVYPAGAQLPFPVVTRYVKQVGSALQYAHEQKAIHGTLRPECLFFRQNRDIVLSDLGLLSLARKSGLVEEHTGPYTAPEQEHGESLPASDQYALACIVYEWLSGEVPVPPLQARTAGLPPLVESVLRTALAAEPGQRFASVQAFMTALAQGGRETMAPLQPAPLLAVPTSPEDITSISAGSRTLPPLQAPPPPLQAPPTAPAAAPENAPSRRQVVKWLGVGAGGLVLVGLGSLAVVKGNSFTPSSPALLPSDPLFTYQHPVDNNSRITFEFDSVAWSPDGRYLLSTSGQSAQIWDINKGGQMREWTLSGGSRAFSWSQDALYVAWTDDRAIIHVQNMISNQEIATYIGHTRNDFSSTVGQIAWSPDGTTIASIGSNGSSIDGVILVWNARTAADITLFSSPAPKSATENEKIASYQERLIWSPNNGSILSWNGGGILYVWDAQNGHLISNYRKLHDLRSGESNPLGGIDLGPIAWSPDSQCIAANPGGTHGDIYVWKVQSGQEVLVYHGQQNQTITQLTWSPDSSLIASLGGDSARSELNVWDATRGTQSYSHPEYAYAHFAWSPQGRRIASHGENETIGLEFQTWDATSGKRIVNYTNATQIGGGSSALLTWSPDGQRIASASGDTIRIWKAREP